MRVLGYLLLVGVLAACSNGSSNPDASSDVDGDSSLQDGSEVADLPDTELEDAEKDSPGDGDILPGDLVAETDVAPNVTGFNSYSIAPAGDLLALWGKEDVLVAVGKKGQIIWRQGSFWTPMRSPTTLDLHCVYGLDTNDIYAGGVDGVVVHYDGVDWKTIDPDVGGLKGIVLRGAWGESGHIYLVGDSATILHKAGSQWELEEGITTYSLHSIWGTSLVDIYVGAAGGSILRRIGGVWSSMQVASGSVSLFGLYGLSQTDIWAGGSQGSLVSFEGASWVSKLSNDTGSRTLRGVWAFSPQDVWFVGDSGVLVKKVGDKWNVAEITGPYYKNRSFYGVWGTGPQEAFAVGQAGAILRYDGKIWVDEAASPTVDLNDLAGNGWDDMMAVGGSGLVIRFDGERWYGPKRTLTADLMSVTRHGKDYLVAGSGGLIAKVTDEKAQVLEAGISTNLNGICSDGSTVTVVGEKGAIYQSKDLKEWKKVSTGIFDVLRDCSVAGGKVYAVGDVGRIVQVEDGKAQTMPVSTITNLRRSAVDADGTVFAVGDNGLVMRFKAQKWEKIHEEPGMFFYGVHVVDGQVIAVGWSGQILRLSDGKSEKVEVPSGGVLLQVFGPSADKLFVVGKKGKMLKYGE